MQALKREDIVKYIIKIQLNFENAYVTSNQIERELLVESWYEALYEYPKEICDAAVNNVLKRSKFAPRLGDITEEIDNLISADAPSDEELWAELVAVLPKVYEYSRYLRYSQHYFWASHKIADIYGELNEELKLYVVNVTELVELAEMSSESLLYERARFFKKIPVLKKHRANKLAAQLFLMQNKENQAQLQQKNDKDKK